MRTDANFNVVVPPYQVQHFVNALIADPVILGKKFAGIRSKDAQASQASDLEAIGTTINKSIGFSILDKSVMSIFFTSLIKEVQFQIRLAEDEGNIVRCAQLVHSLQALYVEEHLYGDAEKLLYNFWADSDLTENANLHHSRLVLGTKHDETIAREITLADRYHYEGKRKEAIQLYIECMGRNPQLFQHPNGENLRIIGNLGYDLMELKYLSEARDLLLEWLMEAGSVDEPDYNQIFWLIKVSGWACGKLGDEAGADALEHVGRDFEEGKRVYTHLYERHGIKSKGAGTLDWYDCLRRTMSEVKDEENGGGQKERRSLISDVSLLGDEGRNIGSDPKIDHTSNQGREGLSQLDDHLVAEEGDGGGRPTVEEVEKVGAGRHGREGEAALDRDSLIAEARNAVSDLMHRLLGPSSSETEQAASSIPVSKTEDKRDDLEGESAVPVPESAIHTEQDLKEEPLRPTGNMNSQHATVRAARSQTWPLAQYHAQQAANTQDMASPIGV
ncbi:hypothetical protein HDV00_007459 [Rhizophlyctis rosea]|nr:hypothetical protein HDV00_007459 [Rhizophlyctis rosea]